MSIEQFEFKELRMHSPHENLCTAIGLIQTQILAADSDINTEVMFGSYHFRRAGLEAAVAMLVAMIEEVEDLQWRKEKAA